MFQALRERQKVYRITDVFLIFINFWMENRKLISHLIGIGLATGIGLAQPFLGLCGHILFQIQCFCFVFRKSVSYGRRGVARRWIDVRWKVLILARITVGQTSESDHLEPTSFNLKCLSCQNKGVFCQLQSNLVISKLNRSAPRSRISTFDPSLEAPGSVLSSAYRICAVRHVWIPVIHFFWKWE